MRGVCDCCASPDCHITFCQEDQASSLGSSASSAVTAPGQTATYRDPPQGASQAICTSNIKIEYSVAGNIYSARAIQGEIKYYCKCAAHIWINDDASVIKPVSTSCSGWTLSASYSARIINRNLSIQIAVLPGSRLSKAVCTDTIVGACRRPATWSALEWGLLSWPFLTAFRL